MIQTEKYMAFRRPEFREKDAGFDTIGEILDQDNSGITAMITGSSPEFFFADDCLPIGNDDLRREFGLPPFADSWPADQQRSGVTPDRAWCHLPGLHYRRPGLSISSIESNK